MKSVLLWGCVVALAVSIAGASQEGAPAPRADMHEGRHCPMGAGEAWTWVRTNSDGHVQTVGISFTEDALKDLPAGGKAVCCGGPAFPLPVPEEVATGGITHAVINWNPHGHPPAGIYDVPHFDFHFYRITQAQRLAITGAGEDAARCTRPVPADQVPAGFVMDPHPVPQMGVHLVDVAAEEFHGTPFRRTLIYGGYDGRVAFIEPMVTLAYLQTHPDMVVPQSLPANKPREALTPAAYGIHYDPAAKVYSVSLEATQK